MRAHRLVLSVALVAMVALAVTLVALRGADRPGSGTPSTTAPTSTSATTEPPETSGPTLTPFPTTSSTSGPTTTTTWTGTATAYARGPSSPRVVALTFDAGSDAGHTAAILDTLRANGVAASFGLTGSWASEHPELARRMALEGHQIVNHSWSHPSFTGRSTGAGPLTTEERLDQLARAEAAIRAVTGADARPWFRPPYGDLDPSVLADVGSVGYRYVAMWTVDSLGWKGVPASEITSRCLAGAEPGAIYLFHVGSASADAEALPAIIEALQADGFGFVTLAQLVAPPA